MLAALGISEQEAEQLVNQRRPVDTSRLGTPQPSGDGPSAPASKPRIRTRLLGWLDRLFTGAERFPAAILAALLAAWTGLLLALWGALIGLILGALVAIGLIAANPTSRQLLHGEAGGALSLVGVAAGAIFGTTSGFLNVYEHQLFNSAPNVILSIDTGIVLAGIVVTVINLFEETFLAFRGYHRFTGTTALRVEQLSSQVASELGLPSTPPFLYWDSPTYGAWTHIRHIVLTQGLLDALDDAELAAVIGHELVHWRNADSIGEHVVWACSLPLVLLYNLATWIGGGIANARKGHGFLSFLLWMLAWPSWILIRLLIAPVTAARSRDHEYDADRSVAVTGRGPALISALRKIDIYPGRTGWEATLHASHPPKSLRIDRLEQVSAGNVDYRSLTIGALENTALRKLANAFAVVVLAAIVGVAAVQLSFSFF